MSWFLQGLFLTVLCLTPVWSAEPTAVAGPVLAPGIEYRVASLNDQVLAVGAAPTLLLDGQAHRASGFTGVNRYSGDYTLAGDVLTIGQAIMTMMAGEEPAMKIEQEFMGIIALPLTISVISGEVLAKNSKGALRLVPMAK